MTASAGLDTAIVVVCGPLYIPDGRENVGVDTCPDFPHLTACLPQRLGAYRKTTSGVMSVDSGEDGTVS